MKVVGCFRFAPRVACQQAVSVFYTVQVQHFVPFNLLVCKQIGSDVVVVIATVTFVHYYTLHYIESI